MHLPGLLLSLLLTLLPAVLDGRPAAAQAPEGALRLATLNPELTRPGPGLLLRDILDGQDEQLDAAAALILRVRPDVLLLTSFDYDLGLAALSAFNERLRRGGGGYAHLFALRPNSGLPSGLDVDGDGRRGEPEDALGYGAFSGQGGLALLSRLPIDRDGVVDFSALPWADLPGGRLPEGHAAAAKLPLASVAHWKVPLRSGCGRIVLLLWRAGSPAFDGPEDLNGLRNRDQNLFWLRYLDGELPWPPPEAPFVLMGDANLDPADGDGHRSAIRALLADPRLQDPAPRAQRGVRAAARQGGANETQTGDPALDTADWSDAPGPGNLRVDYLLPAAGLKVLGSGLEWADAGADTAAGGGAPLLRHALVWADIAWPVASGCPSAGPETRGTR